MDEKERAVYKAIISSWEKAATNASFDFGRLLGLLDGLIYKAETSGLPAKDMLGELKKIRQKAGAWSHEACKYHPCLAA